MLMKLLKILSSITIVIIILLLIPYTSASVKFDDMITLKLITNRVDIEYIQDINSNIKVVANQKISLNHYIKNQGIACYIRFKCDKNDIIIDLNDDWILKSDGYFYYKKMVLSNDKLPLFTKIIVLDKYLVHQDYFHFDIQIEAIQQDNILPDFNDVYPWGDVIVEEYINASLGG